MLYGLLRHFAPGNDKARHCEPHGGAAIQAMLTMNKSLTIILKRSMDCFVISLLAMAAARHCEPHGGAAILAMLTMNKSLTIILKRSMDCFVTSFLAMTAVWIASSFCYSQ